jgi:hypothetical protein
LSLLFLFNDLITPSMSPYKYLYLTTKTMTMQPMV